jgi:hypothetical protein
MNIHKNIQLMLHKIRFSSQKLVQIQNINKELFVASQKNYNVSKNLAVLHKFLEHTVEEYAQQQIKAQLEKGEQFL